MLRTVSFKLNGQAVQVKTDDERMLLWVLRYDLSLTGTKFGCGAGLCGACTVLVDREALHACSTPLKEIEGKRVLTIEGLEHAGGLHPLQEAFLKHQAAQCGYCTPGMVLSACALLLKNRKPSREEIIQHMDGNLCRCGSHVRILAAIEEVAAGIADIGVGGAP